jgi:Ran GTPase-activating protein (RanGAP) involved in mRNA processing and transport
MGICSSNKYAENDTEYDDEDLDNDDGVEEEEELYLDDPRVQQLYEGGLKLIGSDILELLSRNDKCITRLTDAKKPRGVGHASCNEQCGKASNDTWVENLSKALTNNTNIKELTFGGGHQLSSVGIQHLTNSLKSNTSLEKLAMTFGTPGIGPAGAVALSTWLGTNKTLTILDLTDNNLGNDGAVAISNALSNGLNIKTLTLPSNNIGVDGITALAKAFNVTESLASVQLENNLIGDDGAVVLANMLANNKSIETLMLDSNQIKQAGGIALAEVLKTNASITRLSLESHTIMHEDDKVNDIGDEGTIAFAEMLKINKTLRFLNLNDAGTHPESVEVLAQVLNNVNETLLSLKVAPNDHHLIETACKRNMNSHRAAKRWLRKATHT